MSEDDKHLSIGQASERTDLPESTIRYYDREFSEYLSIPRGDNNERLFDEESLEDLEYIRYLIKRENLSIEDVKERLDKEVRYKQAERTNGDEPQEQSTPAGDSGASNPDAESLAEAVASLESRLETVEENQEKILELLDLNLQRYNKLVEDL